VAHMCLPDGYNGNEHSKMQKKKKKAKTYFFKSIWDLLLWQYMTSHMESFHLLPQQSK
jgi:hypothetical protein